MSPLPFQFYRLNLNFTVINRFLFSDKMWIYQVIDVLISVLDHCNILTTNNHLLLWWVTWTDNCCDAVMHYITAVMSYMSNHSSSQV